MLEFAEKWGMLFIILSLCIGHFCDDYKKHKELKRLRKENEKFKCKNTK
jgi:hypothetical protein